MVGAVEKHPWPLKTPHGSGAASTSKRTSTEDFCTGTEIHAVNPDLAKFKARGGKILMYHGWGDGGSGGSISALNPISYYESVLKHVGPNQDDWFRLFMVSRMDPCGGGTGPNQFNKLAALERWREQNELPKSIIAARVNESGVIDMTRPLCPYPQQAVYKGSGSTNDATNYTCDVKSNLTTADGADGFRGDGRQPGERRSWRNIANWTR